MSKKKKKKKKSSRKTKTTRASIGAWLETVGRFLYRIATTPTGKRVLVWSAFAIFFVVLSLRVRARVTDSKRFRISKKNLAIGEPPPWLDPRAVGTLKRLPYLGKGISVFEPGLAGTIARHFAMQPWIRSVKRVELLLPHRVRFRVTLRKPYCYIRRGGRRVLVDREGTVLHRKYYPEDRVSVLGLLPTIEGLPSHVSLREGHRIRGAAFAHGMSVLALLEREELLPVLTGLEVDVRGVPEDGALPRRSGPEIVLGVAGARLLWGRAPISKHLKYPADEKIEILKKILEERSLAAGKTFRLYDGRILEGM